MNWKKLFDTYGLKNISNVTNSKEKNAFMYLDSKLSFFSKHAILSLVLIGSIGMMMRLYYWEYYIPVTSDSFDYFLYAIDIKFLGHLPNGWTPANNGWPIFLSIFFSIFNFDNGLAYMQLQTFLSMILSVLTIVPIYLICKKYVGNTYALIGGSMFILEPRIIQNSLLGVTESLYVLSITLSLVFINSRKNVFVFLSFAICAAAVMIRSEAFLLFFVITILFFVNNKKTKSIFAKYCISVVIFALILIPNVVYKQEVIGTDALFDRISDSVKQYGKTEAYYKGGVESSTTNALITGLENYVKFMIWVSIPTFILFLPIGIYLLFKKWERRNLLLIVFVIFMSLPALYAYSYPHLDTRYLYVIYPVFCVISLFTVKLCGDVFKIKNIIPLIILPVIIASSMVFLSIDNQNNTNKEAFLIAEQLVKFVKGINSSSKVSHYINEAEVLEKWPIMPTKAESEHVFSISKIPTVNYDSLEEFITASKNNQLSHLVIDDSENSPKFLTDIFYQKKDYPYLIKIFDSSNVGYDYKVQIYEIDYELFESYSTSKLQFN